MHLARSLSLPLLALLALVLPACGGGGGGGGGEAGGVNTPVGQLPAIVSTFPQAAEVDVDSDTIIEIVFDNDLNETLIPAGAVRVVDAAGVVLGMTTYDAGRRSLVFSPASPLTRDMRHNIQVLPGIADVDGNVRTESYVFAFDTAPLAAAAAVPHENDAEDTQLLGFAVSNLGKGASLTATDFTNRTDITIRSYDSVAGFGAPINVDSFVGQVSANRAASVAVAASGKGIAVWRVNGPNGPDVYAVSFDAAAGTVGSTHTLDATPDSSDLPQVVMAANGDALIVWTQRAAGADRKVYGVDYQVATGFGARANLEPNGGDVYSPKVAISRFGQAVVAWSLEVGNDFATRARTWNQGSFTAVHTVSYLANTRAFAEKCLVSNNGECVVIMQFANTPVPNYRGVRTKRYRPAGLTNPGWQTLEQPTLEAGENLKLDAALISGGNVLMVYGMDATGGAMLEAREYAMATGWSAPINVTNLPLVTFAALNVRVVSRSDRHTMIDWGYNDGANTTRRAALYFNANLLYQDRVVPAKVNSGRGVIDALGNVRFVSRVQGVFNALETVVIAANGVLSPVVRVDGGTANLVQDYIVDQDSSGRGAIIWDERPGAVGTPYDVMHALID